MQLYRKQAYIVEVRIKSRSRDKALLNSIQGALEQANVSLIVTTVLNNTSHHKDHCFHFTQVINCI